MTGKKKIIGITILMFCATTVLAKIPSKNDYATAVGRYMSVENKPDTAQVDLLSQTIQVRFPQDVQTIGQAMDYLLRFSGYKLMPEDLQHQALKSTLHKPLPIVDRQFGPMPLKDALSTLAGPAFTLVEDPLNREVDFKLKSPFAKKTIRGA